jgi:transcription elongation factor Elf1
MSKLADIEKYLMSKRIEDKLVNAQRAVSYRCPRCHHVVVFNNQYMFYKERGYIICNYCDSSVYPTEENKVYIKDPRKKFKDKLLRVLKSNEKN